MLKTTRDYNANDKKLHIIDTLNLFVHTSPLVDHVAFTLKERLTSLAELGCDLFFSSFKVYFLISRLVDLVSQLPASITCQYKKQQLTKIKGLELVQFFNRK